MHVWVGPIEQELLHDCQDLPLSAPLLRLLKHRQSPPGLQPSRHKRPHRRPSAYLRSVGIHRVAAPIHLHLSSPYPEGYKRTSSGPLTRTPASTTLVCSSLSPRSTFFPCVAAASFLPPHVPLHTVPAASSRSCHHGLFVGLPPPRARLSPFLRCLDLWRDQAKVNS
jgi:hypothetical protein